MCKYTDEVKKHKKIIERNRIEINNLTFEMQNVIDNYRDNKVPDVTMADVLEFPLNIQFEKKKGLFYKRISEREVEVEQKQGVIIDRHLHSDFDEVFFDIQGKLYCTTTKEYIKNGFVIPQNMVHSFFAVYDTKYIGEIR